MANGHGTADTVIRVEFARAARRRLEETGARVLYRESPMFHGVDPVFVHVLRNLAGRLGPRRPRDGRNT